MASPVVDFARFDSLLEERSDRWLEDLKEFCRIPSETGNREALTAAAEWTRDRLRHLGARVDWVTAGDAVPLVLGEIGEGPRTVICLHHYDVQPAAPLELWDTPPFEPTFRDGRLYGRGAVDNKGCALVRVEAVEAYLEAFGRLPCRVRFVFEGEEENGSRGLLDLIAAEPRIVSGDVVLNEGGYIDAAGRPLLTCGLRGMLYVDLTVRTLHGDVHSALATLLPNAALRLLDAIQTLRGGEGALAFPGFRDDVVPPTAEQLAALSAVPFEEKALKDTFGVGRFVAGRTGREAHAASMFEPTCNVSGFSAGWTGEEIKTVIPATARAKLDMRLVPDQDPRRILAALRKHLDGRGFTDVEITTWMSQSPWWSSVSHPVVDAAARASEAVFGVSAERVISSTSSGPMHQMCAPHRLPSVGFGGIHEDSRAHAPNENFDWRLAGQARRVFGRFLALFAELPEVPRLVK